MFDCDSMRFHVYVSVLLDAALGELGRLNEKLHTMGLNEPPPLESSFCGRCGYGPKRPDRLRDHRENCRHEPLVALNAAHVLKFLLCRISRR